MIDNSLFYGSMMLKICQWCGEEYDGRKDSKYCKNPHMKKCEYCGKDFIIKDMKTPAKACSKQHSDLLSQKKRQQKRKCELCQKSFYSKNIKNIFCSTPHEYYCDSCHKRIFITPRHNKKYYACDNRKCVVEITKKTNVDKYGVDNVSKTQDVKNKISKAYSQKTEKEKNTIKEKTQETNQNKYEVSYPTQTESVKEKIRKTNIDKYGVENPAQNKETRKKTQETNKKRYGTESFFQSNIFKEKSDTTKIERYGTANPRWNNPNSLKKATQTNMKKYGVSNPAQNKRVQERIRETNSKRYGYEYFFQSNVFKEKNRQQLLSKYGVDNVAKILEVKEKIKDTNMKKYGVDNPMRSDNIKQMLADHHDKNFNVPNPSLQNIHHYSDYVDFYVFVTNNPMTISELAEYFNVTEHSIRRRVRELKLDDKVIGRYTSSAKEERLDNILQKINGLNYIRNDRNVLCGKELDFFFPDHRFAVEISPTSTHNSLKGWNGSAIGLPKDYHKEKFLKCAEQGIELLTVFDWMPWDKTMEMIEYKLNNSSVRIPARKCIYEEYTHVDKDIKVLVNSWHVLGLPKNFAKNHKVGLLKYDQDILGIAVWGVNKKNYELIRLVFKPGYSVVGGASKLLKNFMANNKEYQSIVTFSDCDLGTGSIYKKLGFSLVEDSKPGLNYYHIGEKKHVKYLSLVKQGADRLLKDFKGYCPVGVGDGLPSNTEIIESYGFLPVYDCGYRKWIFNMSL